MCKDSCKYPERKPKKGKCSKEQIKICHGKEAGYSDQENKDTEK